MMPDFIYKIKILHAAVQFKCLSCGFHFMFNDCQIMY